MSRSRRIAPEHRHCNRGALAAAAIAVVALAGPATVASAQEHRAEQDREITYWLDDPATASFLISHDFTITEAGTEYVHNFVRAGSEAKDPHFWNLETGEELPVRHMTGAELNAMGVYPSEVEPDSGVIQAKLAEPIPVGHTVRIRVQETYTDSGRYYMESTLR